MADFLSKQEIEAAIKDWSQTQAGKAAIRESLGNKKRTKFIPRFAEPKNDSISSQAFMLGKAEEMKEILFKHITADTQTDGRKGLANFPKDAIIVEKPVKLNSNGGIDYLINISFDSDALRRQSLNPTLYPEGITDIISLFVHGYNAKGSVVGSWHGESGVWSVRHRDPNDFMARAVAEFNDANRQSGFVTAALRDKYK